MRRAPFLALGALFVVVAACSSAPAATQGPGGATAAPIGATSAPGPTQPGGGVPVGTACAGIPTMDPLHPAVPSFGLDVELAARFPQEIDGVPVTDLNTVRWVDYLCTLGGGQVAVDYFASNVPQGLNFATFSHAYADAIVDGEEVDLTAYRAPGQDANLMIQSFSQLIRALGGADVAVTNTTNATIGGKNVFIATDANGGVGYLYPLGDVLFVVADVVTDSQAAKIFAAFP